MRGCCPRALRVSADGRLAVVACALACVPVIAALAAVSAALELGGDAPWTFTLMVADGQIGLGVAISACFLAGCLFGVIALSLGRREPIPADA